MENLVGKTAVVTGAAGGIGLAMANRFAKAGMNIVLADVEEPLLAEAAIEVAAHGVETLTVPTDVSDGDAVDRLLAASIDRFERVNVLCNNAGVAGDSIGSNLTGLDMAEWKWVMDVNIWGVIHGHRAFIPHLLEHGDGHIVNTASMAGHFPGNSAYSVSKWAVVAMSEGLYGELDRHEANVGISCLCPGWVNTEIANSNRNRPEWARPAALSDAAEEANETNGLDQFVRDSIAAGLDPNHVANLVHDAVVNNKFWIFTHPEMQAMLGPRYESILAGENPVRMFSVD